MTEEEKAESFSEEIQLQSWGFYKLYLDNLAYTLKGKKV